MHMPAAVAEEAGCDNIVLCVFAALTLRSQMFRSALHKLSVLGFQSVPLSKGFLILFPNGLLTVIAATVLFGEGASSKLRDRHGLAPMKKESKPRRNSNLVPADRSERHNTLVKTEREEMVANFFARVY